MKLIIKTLSKSAIVPIHRSSETAGLDLYADENCEIRGGERKRISTNICIEWVKNNANDQNENPENFYLRVCPIAEICAGNIIQTGLGIIDFDYIGEIKVMLINNGANTFTIKKGKRIAEVVLTRKLHDFHIISQNNITENR
jgi:dUTP pyrophosphatase